MTENITVPSLGESVTSATVVKWLKKTGEEVTQDELLVELETDKITLEINAPKAGTVSSIQVPEGAVVKVGDVLAILEERPSSAGENPSLTSEASSSDPDQNQTLSSKESLTSVTKVQTLKKIPAYERLSPAVKKMVAEHGLDPQKISGTGKEQRLLKEDVQSFLQTHPTQETEALAPSLSSISPLSQAETLNPSRPREDRVKMTALRRRIAERLKEAQNKAALLTTFNEIDMSQVTDVRSKYQDVFEKKYGVRLGFMSFFVKASLVALKEFPVVNAEISGEDILYKNYYDLGVAVSTLQGLVVPILRNADQMAFSEIEKAISVLATRAREGTLTMGDLTGGTFTLTNGGVFGSLLSTPILNPPQSAILGMHKIQKRPVVVEDQIVIRPMMYVALTYDHRIIDGREAVTFLKRVKEGIEDPERLLLDL